MTTYYYDKTNYGKEHCYKVDSIADDCQLRLSMMGDDATCAVTIIRDNDVMGYSSIEEYVKGECPETPTAEFEAMAEYLDGGTYPFSLVRHRGGEYEAMAEKDVDWQELASEFEDFGHWQIQPGYYDSADITPEDADKQGMYALASALRGEQGDDE